MYPIQPIVIGWVPFTPLFALDESAGWVQYIEGCKKDEYFLSQPFTSDVLEHFADENIRPCQNPVNVLVSKLHILAGVDSQNDRRNFVNSTSCEWCGQYWCYGPSFIVNNIYKYIQIILLKPFSTKFRILLQPVPNLLIWISLKHLYRRCYFFCHSGVHTSEHV